MSPLLTVLNDLSWVIECAAMDHMGEANSSLRALSEALREHPAYRISDAEAVARNLEVARNAYFSGDRRLGAHELMVVSRALWDQVGIST